MGEDQWPEDDDYDREEAANLYIEKGEQHDSDD